MVRTRNHPAKNHPEGERWLDQGISRDEGDDNQQVEIHNLPGQRVASVEGHTAESLTVSLEGLPEKGFTSRASCSPTGND